MPWFARGSTTYIDDHLLRTQVQNMFRKALSLVLFLASISLASSAFAVQSTVTNVTAQRSDTGYIVLAASCNGDNRYYVDVSTAGGEGMMRVGVAALLSGKAVSYVVASGELQSGKCVLQSLQLNN